MRFFEPVTDGIKNLDEHCDGGGKPPGLRGVEIPIYSRIALMAQVIDVFHVSNGPDAALRETQNRSGAWFDPHLRRTWPLPHA
jgi:response regulator RpfG family c-di-GMP phosphodiesterase